MADSIACRISNAADRAISHPAAFVIFNIAWALSYKFAGIEVTNVAISILTADILFITAISARRARLKLEREAEELVKVNPDIDEKHIQA